MKQLYERRIAQALLWTAGCAALVNCSAAPAVRADSANAVSQNRENTVSTIAVDDVEIHATFERADATYLHQETIRLTVTFRNNGSVTRTIPYVVNHTLTLELRTADGHDVQSAERKYQPPPPLRNMPEPVVELEPTKDVTYRLPIDVALSVIPPGTYQLRMVVPAPPMGFSTPWLPLHVVTPRTSAPRGAASSTFEARTHNTAWRDDGVTPSQVLLESRQLRSGLLRPETQRLGAGDASSEPAIGITPPGIEANSAWVAWLAGRQLVVSNTLGDKTTPRNARLPSGHLALVNPWMLTQNPDGSGTRIQGVLVDDDSGQLFGFAGDDMQVRVLSGGGAGAVRAIATVPADKRTLAAVVARADGARTAIEGWTFESGQPGVPFRVAAIGGVVETLAINASGNGRIHWAAVERSDDRTRLRVFQGSYTIVGETKTSTAPSSHDFEGGSGPWTASVAFDESHYLWALRVDATSATVFKPGGQNGVLVALPKGFRYATLIFRRGTLPQIHCLDPVHGFAMIPVDLAQNDPMTYGVELDA